jgi:uncharacterized 2Fe-2S/4Fe-4S cluster protein (DUF4445 family)
MVRVTVENIGVFTVREDLNLRAGLRSEGVYLDGTCADEGRCGRCVVRILDGEHGEPGPTEAGLLGEEAVVRGDRLACRITPTSDLSIVIDPERIMELDRTGRWKETWQSPLWRPEMFPATYQGYGLAVDLGTTSIASALYDLAAARPVDIKSNLNPQGLWGEEILSRLSAAQESDAASQLKTVVWRTISDQIRALCLRNGITPGRITRVVVVGNTAMHHLALGLPTASLIVPPFEPSDRRERVMMSHDLPLGEDVAQQCEVTFPPLVGGFVGSDALAAALVCRFGGTRAGALVDVGTNTEIVVWNGDRIVAASAPAGPAFEGGHIRDGMRAEEGAICGVKVSGTGVEFRTIGDVDPQGICGTGIVDVVAGLLEAALIDGTGLLRQGSHPSVDEIGLVLDGASGIRFAAKDIETVQKAKAAIRAALDLLLARVGLEEKKLARVFLAGAFGGRLNVGSAISIGLIPDIPEERYVLAGNAALVGASAVLLSEKAQESSVALTSQIEHLTVAEDPGFEEAYLENLFFHSTRGNHRGI